MHRVLFASSELAPLVKSGGLADVSAALPHALARLGARVALVLPGYPELVDGLRRCESMLHLDVLGMPVRIVRGEIGGMRAYLVVCDPLFARPGGPYGYDGGDYADNALRFGVFGRAVASLVEFGHRVGCTADVLHLNDWPCALAAGLVRMRPERPRIVFAIHNLAHQGVFPAHELDRLALPRDWWSHHGVEFHGSLSFIKCGLVFADAIATVSPTYAHEIQQPLGGAGLEGLMRHLAPKLHGIVNGIDDDAWNPATDPHIEAHFDRGSIERKAANRQALRAELGLRHEDVPLLGFVGRLVDQKGVDIIVDALDGLVDLPAQLAVLGTGEKRYASTLEAASARHAGRIAFANRLDDGLAHRIEAGADVFLMPSRFEPCGLNQMYSMRYGTVPVVRRTGGLADTVEQVWSDAVGDGTGFLFDDPTPEALLGTLRPVMSLFRNPPAWRRIQHNGMSRDLSWRASAGCYLSLYTDLVAGRVQC